MQQQYHFVRQYEYKVEIVKMNLLQDQLNLRSSQGWEVFTIDPTPGSMGEILVCYRKPIQTVL